MNLRLPGRRAVAAGSSMLERSEAGSRPWQSRPSAAVPSAFALYFERAAVRSEHFAVVGAQHPSGVLVIGFFGHHA